MLDSIFNETTFFFSPEILCLLGVLINLILFLFFRKKINIKRLSDFITVGIFNLNLLIYFSIYIRNYFKFSDFNFTLLNNNLIFDTHSIVFKFLINLFFVFFILSTYKLTRKARFKTPLVNNMILLLTIVSSFLIQIENGLISFILLDISSLLVYKYASNMRIAKYDVYSPNYIMMNLTSTILFLAFYIASLFIKDDVQITIMQVCMTLALFLKAGIFPIFNYTLNRHYKNNVPSSLLFFGLLPFLGVVTYLNFISFVNYQNEIYSFTIMTFLILTMITSSFSAIKTKNIVRFLACSVYVFCSLYSILILFNQDKIFVLNSLFILLFMVLALYSMLSILKINFKVPKINMNLLKGLFENNALFPIALTICLLMFTSLVPSIFGMNNYKIVKMIYEFDKLGFYVVFAFLISNMFIMINSFKMIKYMYTMNSNSLEITKRTTLNYIVLFVIIIFFIISLFL